MPLGFNPMDERVCHARSLIKTIPGANFFDDEGREASWSAPAERERRRRIERAEIIRTGGDFCAFQKRCRAALVTAVQNGGAVGRAHHSVRAVVVDQKLLVAGGGGQGTARPTNLRRTGDGGEGSLVAPTCLAEVGRRRK